MRVNTAERIEHPRTYEGAIGPQLTAEQQLQRSVLTCLLWEDNFYEHGESIADRIDELARKVRPEAVAALAVAARTEQHLRHVPLLLLSVLAETATGTSLVSDTIPQVVKRADELGELLAVYAKLKGVSPSDLKPVLTNQLKRGLGLAFRNFDAYQLAKYDRANTAVRLRDVMRLCHPKPRDEEQAALWRQLLDGELKAPDTWEVALSGGADKKETFERLIMERRLGYMALLRNLRGMMAAGVQKSLIEAAILSRRGAGRVLPFRFVSAARACPAMEPALDVALCAEMEERPQWEGRTVVLVDVSGSMTASLSSRSRSTLNRMDAACALAALVPAPDKEVYSFSARTVRVPPRDGMALIDAIQGSQHHGWTALGQAVADMNRLDDVDRLLVVTDEQSRDTVPAPKAKFAWMVNLASHQNGVGIDGKWHRINGWSDNVLRYIRKVEALDALEGR